MCKIICCMLKYLLKKTHKLVSNMYEDTVKRPWPETKEKRAKKTAGVLGTKSVKSDLDTKGRGVRELKGHTQINYRYVALTQRPHTDRHSWDRGA